MRAPPVCARVLEKNSRFSIRPVKPKCLRGPSPAMENRWNGMTPLAAHSNAYRRRRFRNWFPLGLTYATFYMGRYNFNVAKGVLGETFHLDKAEVGAIATAGFWTYALSVMLNGPLADRIGGKRAIV